jgi:UDP-2,3-diacylglucosamine pyrophosphatase LpxH
VTKRPRFVIGRDELYGKTRRGRFVHGEHSQGWENQAMLDAVIVSDIHLGSDNCEAKRLCRFLEQLVDGELHTSTLILNGDVFDSIDFRRLKKQHWKVLSLIRKLSDKMHIIWISGNHDGPTEIVSHLLGTTVQEEHVLESGGRRILVLHGHIFDEFIEAHPILTWFSDVIYWLLQCVDRTHSFAKWAKKSSKVFLRCAKKVEDGSIDRARKRGCSAVCCGHTHHAMVEDSRDVHYFNGGCWTEWPGTYLTIIDGQIRLESFAADLVAELEEEPATPQLQAT